MRDFESLVLRLGGRWVEDQAVVRELFRCFDHASNGLLDPREAFLGLVLLCNDSREERLRALFAVLEEEGKLSRGQIECLVRFLWPHDGDSMHDTRVLLRTSRIMLEADQERSGFVTHAGYTAWEGKELELKMMDARLVSILSRF